MAPVQWKDGWPVILEGNEEVKYKYPVPMPSITKKVSNSFGGNAFYNDEFNNPRLNDRFMFLRTVREPRYSLTESPGMLTVNLRKEICSKKVNPSFIGFWQQNLHGEASVLLQFPPKADNEKAGLTIFQSETNFYYFCKAIRNGRSVAELYRSTKDSTMELMDTRSVKDNPESLRLKIEARGGYYFFYYSSLPEGWTYFTKEVVDGKFLSTKTAGGFVGCVFAMHATSMGKESNTKAYFDWFKYKGKDGVYQ